MSNREMPPIPSAPSEKSEGAKMPAEKSGAIRGPIEVVAIARGFYKKERKDVGDHFTVPTFEELGTWMKCVNPVHQKAHEAAIKIRKQQIYGKANQKAGE